MNVQELAQSTIRKNATKEGLKAGSTHFNDIWARDALFACWGLLPENKELVEQTMTTLQQHTSKQGQIPLRVGNKNMFLVFSKLPSPQGPRYENDKSNDPALDPNSLYLITLELLTRHDKKCIIDKEHTKKVVGWLLRFQRADGLFIEGTYASWDDSLKKQAPSIYNNALIYAALQASAKLLNDKEYECHAQKLKETTNKQLYTGEYFRAWEGMDVFDVPGNLLAIYLGLTNKNQEEQILNTLKNYKKKHKDTLPKTNYPKYPGDKIYRPFKLVGMADYHNQGSHWSWVAILEVLVTKDGQQLKKLEPLFQKGICEIYDDEMLPTKRLFYQSEQDFSWSAGLLLLAYKEINKI